MKLLILKNGDTMRCTDDSTINRLVAVVTTFNAVDVFRGLLTQENLSKCTFDGVEYTDVVLEETYATAVNYGDIQVTFTTKTTAEDEINALRAQVAQLEAEKAELADKAEAADILLGNEEV